MWSHTAKFHRQNAVISIGISMFGNFGWGTRVEKFPHVDFALDSSTLLTMDDRPTLSSKFHQSFTNVTTLSAENRNWFDANTCSDICQNFGHIGKKESICKCTFILKKTGLIHLKLAAPVLESCGCFPELNVNLSHLFVQKEKENTALTNKLHNLRYHSCL